MYLESREGGASKFWSAMLDGRMLHVRWGRIGTEGQQQVKQFPSPAQAKAEFQKLVAQKKSKGYVPAKAGVPVPPKASARRARPASTRASGGDELEELCTAIEEYFEKLKSVEGLDLTPEELVPEKASAISAFEKKFGVMLPDEVRAFLRRGLRHASAFTPGDAFGRIGFDFIGLKHMTRMMQIHRESTRFTRDDAKQTDLLMHGVALSYSEPRLVVHCGPGRAAGAIYHYSPRNPLLPPVTRSLTEFLRHWLATGCFGSHDFDAVWSLVEPHVPVKLSRKKNLWLRYYDAQFRTKYAR
jgi:predicted DNA-binding WGR domain protein